MTATAYQALIQSRHLPPCSGYELAAQRSEHRWELCKSPVMCAETTFVSDTLVEAHGLNSFHARSIYRDLVTYASGDALDTVVDTAIGRMHSINMAVSLTDIIAEREDPYTDTAASKIAAELEQLDRQHRPQRSAAADAVLAAGVAGRDTLDRIAALASPAQRVRYVLERGYTEQRCVAVLCGPAATAHTRGDHQAFRLLAVARPYEAGELAASYKVPAHHGAKGIAATVRVAASWASLQVWRTAPRNLTKLSTALDAAARHPDKKWSKTQRRIALGAIASAAQDPYVPDSVRNQLDAVLCAYGDIDARRDRTSLENISAADVFAAVNTATLDDPIFGCLSTQRARHTWVNSYDTEQLIADRLGNNPERWRFALHNAYGNNQPLDVICELAAAV